MKRAKKIMAAAIEFNGVDEQLNMAVEECNELGAAINHFRRNKICKQALIKEIADVWISLEYLKMIHNISKEELDDEIGYCFDCIADEVSPK